MNSPPPTDQIKLSKETKLVINRLINALTETDKILQSCRDANFMSPRSLSYIREVVDFAKDFMKKSRRPDNPYKTVKAVIAPPARNVGRRAKLSAQVDN